MYLCHSHKWFRTQLETCDWRRFYDLVIRWWLARYGYRVFRLSWRPVNFLLVICRGQFALSADYLRTNCIAILKAVVGYGEVLYHVTRCNTFETDSRAGLLFTGRWLVRIFRSTSAFAGTPFCNQWIYSVIYSLGIRYRSPYLHHCSFLGSGKGPELTLSPI